MFKPFVERIAGPLRSIQLSLLPAKRERRRRKIGEQSQLMALGQDGFTQRGFLRQDFPRGRAIRRHRCPPMRRIIRPCPEQFGGGTACWLRRMTSAQKPREQREANRAN